VCSFCNAKLGEDCMTDIRKTPNGCNEWGKKKRVNGPKKDEGTSHNKLRGMGMMGEWMEVGTHLGIGVELTISFPSGDY
jgi:hypothetical protein